VIGSIKFKINKYFITSCKHITLVLCDRQMLYIRTTQIELNDMGAVIRALPHLARPCDRTAKEVLAFVCIMLFNANEEIQVVTEDDRVCIYTVSLFVYFL